MRAQEFVGQRVEVGQEAGRRASPADRPARSRRRPRRPHRRHRTDWAAASRGGRARPLTQRAAAIAARNRPSREPLSTSISVAGSSGRGRAKRRAEPVGGRAAERVGALVHRIAAEIADIRSQHRADKGGHRMLRLADRQADRRLAGRGIAQQLAQPHERRAAVDGPIAGNGIGGPGGRWRLLAFGGVHEHR